MTPSQARYFAYPVSGEEVKSLPFGCLGTSSATEAANLRFDSYRIYTTHTPADSTSGVGCTSVLCRDPWHSIGECTVTIISRVPMMVADIILIYVTWTNLSGLDTWREMRHARRLSLPDIFVREGMCSHVLLTMCLTSRPAMTGTVYFMCVRLSHVSRTYSKC